MIPFRIFNKERKEMWIILNYQPGQNGGTYLAAREEDSDEDGKIKLFAAEELLNYRLIDFLDDNTDDYRS